MYLTIERFDLDPSVREPNTARATPASAPFPTDFPFVVDDDTQEIVEPIALFLASKFNNDACFRNGTWTKMRSARAAAEDLKVWWHFLSSTGSGQWDDVGDRVLASYLRTLLRTRSEKTGRHLDAGTIRRHCASIDAFYEYARLKWPGATFPSVNSAKVLAGFGVGRTGHETDRLPRPISETSVRAINSALGPLPTSRLPKQSSRSRLAFAIAVQVGLRIDEILHLRADTFDRMSPSPADGMKASVLRIQKTKGLVPRDVHFPNWLILELKHYIQHERAESLQHGRRTWLRDAKDEPWQLLLNRPDARGRNAGKSATADSIEADFNSAVKGLGLMMPTTNMEGTASKVNVDEPRHVFHDGRHTYAHWTFSGLLTRGHKIEGAWLLLRNRLGHKNVRTTIDTYLRAFSELDEGASDLLVEHLAKLNREANP